MDRARETLVALPLAPLSLPMTTSTDIRRFGMHPALIFGIISRQSGLLWRAGQELISNAYDAQATTCRITLTPENFVIEDDGTGFGDLANIEKFFGTFGTPHDEVDAHKKIARHRMGRGSIMGHASTIWTTGPHKMEVDIRNKGLDYRLTTDNPIQTGCRIEGTFYERLPLAQFNSLMKDLKQACEYMPLDVYLNGELIRIRWDTIKWTHEDEACLFLSRPGSSLSLYNLGCFVFDRPTFQTGVSGVLVSKHSMELNQARSEVVERECPVWKRIEPVLERYTQKERAERPHSLSPASRIHQLKGMLLNGVVGHDVSATLTANVFPLAPSGWASIKQIDNALSEREGVVISDGSNTPLDEAIALSKAALVLSPELLQHLNQPNPDAVRDLIVAFAQKLQAAVQKSPGYLRGLRSAHTATASWRHTDFFADHFNTEKKRLTEADITELERNALAVAESMNDFIYSSLHKPLNLPRTTFKRRRLIPGTSASALAWTDGSTYIAIERRVLKRALSGMDTLSELATTLIHEYLHMEGDLGTHAHDAEFMDRFHSVCQTGLVGTGVLQGLKRIMTGASAHRSKPYKVPASMIKQIDFITRLSQPAITEKIEQVEPEPDTGTDDAIATRVDVAAAEALELTA